MKWGIVLSKNILFQGDSITDSGRNRESDNYAGYGYPTLVKAQLGFDNPGEYVFFNRGVSGDRVLDMYARIIKDVLNLKPDYISILIGVNDIWHGMDWNNGTGLTRYEKVYNIFIDEILSELPDIKIMIMEPFVLRGTATDDREDQPDRFNEFSSGVYEIAKAARRVAKKHNLPFVELQESFNKACELNEASYWLIDGVHPTTMGHELIKREWIETFNKIK